MNLEQSIKYVAILAGRIRWDLPEWDGTDIRIKRVEQIDANSWRAVYDEPDTGTEEDMIVERVGNTLQASYTEYEGVLARLEIQEGK